MNYNMRTTPFKVTISTALDQLLREFRDKVRQSEALGCIYLGIKSDTGGLPYSPFYAESLPDKKLEVHFLVKPGTEDKLTEIWREPDES